MRKLLLIVTALVLLLTSCAADKQSVSTEAMDTFMKFEYYGDEKAGDELADMVKSLDKALSVTDKNSEIFRLNSDGSTPLSKDSLRLIKRSLELCEKLGGTLDITILPVVEKWGFINQNYRVPPKSEIDEALKKVNYNNVSVYNSSVTLKNGAKIDLGAVAKGYAADKSKQILREHRVSSAILNFGGTIAAVGSKPDNSPWRVGIADPENPSGYLGFISCRDKIIATSGGYERYFDNNGRRFIHIIDPKSGYPVDNDIASVSVISGDGVLCDALSTALFVKGLSGALRYCRDNEDFDCVIVTKDKKIYISDSLADSFTLSDDSYKIIKE